MKTKSMMFAGLLIGAASVACCNEPDQKTLERFAPLINLVRGAVRMQIENGNGCLPWIRLTRDPANAGTYKDFAFSPELVKQLDGAPNSKIVPPIARVAAEGGYTMSVLGRCGDDLVVPGKRLGVIELTLEEVGSEPILLRFPYELTSSRKVKYHLDRVAYSETDALILPVTHTAQAPKPSEVISVTPLDDHFEVTVPVSHATLVIPRGALHEVSASGGGATKSPRYFKLEDESTGTIVSGWFESSSRIGDARQALDKAWTVEAAALSKSGHAAFDVEVKNLGSWQTITYGVNVEDGSSRHIRASQVIADTWVDLHLSVTRNAPAEESKAAVLSLLQEIAIRTR